MFWTCGHSTASSATAGGILGVVGWASKNLLNDGFYAAKSTKQGENGKNLRLFSVFDYATWQGSASSVALRPRSAVREVLHARKLAIPSLRSLHSDQKSGVVRFPIFLYLSRKSSRNLAFSQYNQWACSSLLSELNKPIFRTWPHVWPLAEIFGLFSATFHRLFYIINEKC